MSTTGWASTPVLCCNQAWISIGTSCGAPTNPLVTQNATPTSAINAPVTIEVLCNVRPKIVTGRPRSNLCALGPSRCQAAASSSSGTTIPAQYNDSNSPAADTSPPAAARARTDPRSGHAPNSTTNPV